METTSITGSDFFKTSSAQQLHNCRKMGKELARESIALDHKWHMWCPSSTVRGPVSGKTL